VEGFLWSPAQQRTVDYAFALTAPPARAAHLIMCLSATATLIAIPVLQSGTSAYMWHWPEQDLLFICVGQQAHDFNCRCWPWLKLARSQPSLKRSIHLHDCPVLKLAQHIQSSEMAAFANTKIHIFRYWWVLKKVHSMPGQALLPLSLWKGYGVWLGIHA